MQTSMLIGAKKLANFQFMVWEFLGVIGFSLIKSWLTTKKHEVKSRGIFRKPWNNTYKYADWRQKVGKL